ncbi:hypothetical protein RFI_25075, partial [Reticulomyxa filosa]
SQDQLIPGTSMPISKMDRAFSAPEEEPLPALPFELELQNYQNAIKSGHRRDTVQEQVTTSCMSWLISFSFCCPNFSQYLALEDDSRRLKLIGRVPRENFPNDISPPVFCVRHFQVKRSFHFDKFLFALLNAIIFPLVLVIQTFVFLIYSSSWYASPLFFFLENDTSAYPQVSVMFDYLAPIVGRDHSDLTKFEDVRQWFLTQTIPQKIARILLTPIVCALFGMAFFSGYQIYVKEDTKVQLYGQSRSFLIFFFFLILKKKKKNK